jgi:hypothetical protein
VVLSLLTTQLGTALTTDYLVLALTHWTDNKDGLKLLERLVAKLEV